MLLLKVGERERKKRDLEQISKMSGSGTDNDSRWEIMRITAAPNTTNSKNRLRSGGTPSFGRLAQSVARLSPEASTITVCCVVLESSSGFRERPLSGGAG